MPFTGVTILGVEILDVHFQVRVPKKAKTKKIAPMLTTWVFSLSHGNKLTDLIKHHLRFTQFHSNRASNHLETNKL